MVRVRKSRLVVSLIFIFIAVLFYKSYVEESRKFKSITGHIKKNSTQVKGLSSLVIIINEFEHFDNDVSDTSLAALSACRRECNVYIISDDLVYPPLNLPKGARHLILKSNLLKLSVNVKKILSSSKYILFLPDGARISSYTQIKDHIHLLEAGDTQVVALGVGGPPLSCHHYLLDIKGWSLVITPAPHSEACDGVSGRAAFLLSSNHLLNLTWPFSRPTTLSLSIQGTARGWKIHVSRGSVLGEGRHLFASDHFQWKYQTVVDERTKSLYKQLGIKKVVQPSRKVEWYGCTRNTPRCFPSIVDDTPSYLYEGRWTPPCCLEGLRVTARHVFQSLHECRVRWWLEGGSLLGAVRSGDIIPWDSDVDLGIYAVDVEKCPQLKSSRWQTLEDSKGFVWQKASEGNFYRVHYSTANNLHVDIFPFHSKNGMMARLGAWNTGHRQDVDFPEHFLKPFSSVMFVGVTATAPNNVRDFLEFKFGMGVVENPQYPNMDVLWQHNVTLPSFT